MTARIVLSFYDGAAELIALLHPLFLSLSDIIFIDSSCELRIL